MDSQTKRNGGLAGVSSLRWVAPLLISTCVGLALSFILFSVARRWEKGQIQGEFQRLAGDRAVTLQRSIDRNLEVLHSIGRLFAASGKVERQEFSEFVKGTLDRHNDIQVLSWVPRIKDSERAAFEKTTRAMGSSGFEVTEWKAQGQMVGAERREEYFPVYYLNPMEGNEAAFGYDLASNPTRLASLEKSRDTGRLLVTGRITLVQEAGRQYGVLFVKPIYRNGAPTETIEERRENLVGYATGAFRIGDMVEASLKVLSGRGIDVYLYDETAPEDKQLLHVYGPKAIGAEAHSIREHEEAANIRKGPYWHTMLSVPGRKWSLLFISAPEFLATERTWQPQGALLGGLLLTALMVTYLLNAIRHTVKLQSEVIERKRAEEAVREAHEELQQAYDTLEKAQASAIAAEKLAAIGRLTAGVSHEIMNPLTVITLSLHRLIKNPDIPPEVASDLLDLEEQADRIAKIAQHLTYFARQRKPERRPVDINEIANRTLGLIEHELKLQNIAVDLKLSEELPPILADQGQLQQVILNLLTNAQYAMPDGGRLVLSIAEAQPMFHDEVKLVELRVEDTGPGIPPEHMDKLFDPFFTTKPEGDGTGMGLSICQGIVEAHGGLLWAENVPGGGAAFIVRLGVEGE